MSVPMIKALKSGSAFNFLPSAYFSSILGILVYSFGDDQKSFDDILSTMKRAFINYYERIVDTCFINLLDKLLTRMKQFNLKWFQNQN